jgi:hypothetical protein
MLNELMGLLNTVNILEVDDRWYWTPGGEDGFSVKSTYVFLDHALLSRNLLSPVESFVFKFIWKCGVPSKVSALAWQMLLDRVPTRENLCRRGVVGAVDSMCPFCSLEVESVCHLFLHCSYTAKIWYAVINWYGAVLVLPPNLHLSFVGLVGCGSNKRRRKGLAVVWSAYVWAVWKARNDRIFNNRLFEVVEVVELIQRLSWRWFLNSSALGSSLLYEWVWNPADCMLR